MTSKDPIPPLTAAQVKDLKMGLIYTQPGTQDRFEFQEKTIRLLPALIEMAEELAALRKVAEELMEDTPEFVGGCCLPSYCAACGGEDETHEPICPRVSLRTALDALPKEGGE
jgi:hypothetical protein